MLHAFICLCAAGEAGVELARLAKKQTDQNSAQVVQRERSRQCAFLLQSWLFRDVKTEQVPGYQEPGRYSHKNAEVSAARQHRITANRVLERGYIQAHYPYAPSRDARMQYLRAQPPDGSIEWWVALASSNEIQQAAAHIRVEIQRLVEVIQDPAAKHPRMPQLQKGEQRRINRLLQEACA